MQERRAGGDQRDVAIAVAALAPARSAEPGGGSLDAIIARAEYVAARARALRGTSASVSSEEMLFAR